MKGSEARHGGTELFRTMGLLALLGVIAHALQIPWLGFYFDDWFFAWVGHVRGPEGLIESLSEDRPFSGYLFALDHMLLGENVVAWHLYAFGWRLAGAFACLWTLRSLWPRRRIEAVFTSMFFLLYPGFLQQPISIMYQNYLVPLALISVSLGCTVQAERGTRRLVVTGWTLAALASAAGCHLVLEAFIGFELVRVALVAYMLKGRRGAFVIGDIPRLLAKTLPYLSSLAVILVWRVFLFRPEGQGANAERALSRYVESPLEIARFGVTLGKDFVDSVLWAWFVPAYQLISASPIRELAVAFLLAVGGGGLVYAHYRRLEDSNTAPSNLEARRLLSAGMAVALLGLVPSLLAGRTVHLGTLHDRFTVPAAVGAAMTLTGGVLITMRPALRRIAFTGLTILMLCVHGMNMSAYRAHWLQQRTLWWQLTWRVPQLRDGTLIALNTSGLDGYDGKSSFFSEDYEIWGPLNWIYNRGNSEPRLGGEILNERYLEGLVGGGILDFTIRGVAFELPYSSTLVVSAPTPDACLRVIDPSRPALAEQAGFLARTAVPYSRIDLVVTQPPSPVVPPPLLGGEPARDWCYFYQKAELSRQQQAWEEIIALWNEADRLRLRPKQAAELLVFSDAFSRLGLHDKTTD